MRLFMRKESRNSVDVSFLYFRIETAVCNHRILTLPLKNKIEYKMLYLRDTNREGGQVGGLRCSRMRCMGKKK